MGESNKYWTATDKAFIPNLDWVSASWRTGDHCANKLDLINGAFEIYYLSRKSIDGNLWAVEALSRERPEGALHAAGPEGSGQ